MTNTERLIGKKVERIFMNETHLQFVTDQGAITYTVEGDCCSHSYFYDFIGVKKLLENGPIISVKEIDVGESEDNGGDYIQKYGFSITTESEKFGEMTSVFSFRNSSNGYYGGRMEDSGNIDVSPEIFDDILETDAND